MIPPIAIGFLLLGAALLWAVTSAGGAWWLKLAGIVAVSTYTFAVWSALGSFTGWPTQQGLPQRGLFVGSVVVEPRGHQPGRIYMWLIPPKVKGGPLDYKPGGAEPRAYRLPYTRPDHEQAQKAEKMAGEGQRVEIKSNSTRNAPGARFTPYRLPPTLPATKARP